ncbi:unnamed protein product [Auanema sp. JU1783]|nr:unnamed protein product [Auanema sp. JU1783]
MSSETLQLIVSSLSREPFNMGLSVITFDSLPSSKLLQCLSDVLCWIYQIEKINITQEAPEETAVRIFNNLRILRFRPPSDPEELDEWRAGIVEGSKKAVYPVLAYIFSNLDMLKERVYLSKYLVKVEIPSEVHDMDTAQLQNELADLMEKFKEVHSRVTDVQQDSIILDDIRSDLKMMESEKEALIRKIERAERKVQKLPALERHLSSAEYLRSQRNRLAELNVQRTDQRESVIHIDQKLSRFRAHYNELQAASKKIDHTMLIAQLEDEIATNNYLVNNKLKNDIANRKQIVSELAKISAMPAIDQKDIQDLHNEVKETTNNIMNMEQERDRSEEALDDNLSIFRHQATAVERKKEAVAGKLQQTRQTLTRMESQIEEKKKELKTKSGVDVISGKEFRNYVNLLRARTQEYKKKRQELDEIITEKGTLIRTMEMLSRKYNTLVDKIKAMGGEVVAFGEQTNMTKERPRTAAPVIDDVDELRRLLSEMVENIEKKRDKIDPLKKEKEKQQERYTLLNDYVSRNKTEKVERNEQKASAIGNLNTDIENLEQRLEEVLKEIKGLDSKIEQYTEDLNVLRSDGDELKKRVQEEYRKAQEVSSDLARRQGITAKYSEFAHQQVIMWRGLHMVFEAKMQAVKKAQG